MHLHIPSLTLTFSPLKMDCWNTIVSFWDGLFSGATLVSGRVFIIIHSRMEYSYNVSIKSYGLTILSPILDDLKEASPIPLSGKTHGRSKQFMTARWQVGLDECSN